MRFFDSLGLQGVEDDVLLTGPSIYGLLIPAQSMALSIAQITSLFLTLDPTVDNVAIMKVFQLLLDEVSKEFINAENELYSSK